MRRLLLMVLVLSLAFGIVWAVAADPDTLTISRSAFVGGGGDSNGGQYALVGTIGQTDAGDMSGGDFGLSGGFWNEEITILPDNLYSIYLPVIITP